MLTNSAAKTEKVQLTKLTNTRAQMTNDCSNENTTETNW